MQIVQKFELKQILSPILPLLDHVDTYIQNFIHTDLRILNVSAAQIFKKPGKKIRASFVLLGAGLGLIPEGSGDKEYKKRLSTALDLAAGVELVHAATLVHDDIIDLASFRRGEQTVSSAFGNKVGVLVGDWLFTRGLDIAAAEKHPRILPTLIDATREMVKGELAQIEFSGIKTIQEKHYLSIISAKTAKFLGACIQVGAYHAGMSDEDADLLYQFGYSCGMGFQIADDLMDFSQKSVTGKDGANDYLDGKVTLPVIYLLDKSADIKKKLIELFAERDLEKFGMLQQLVYEHNTLEMALAKGRVYVDQGLLALRKLRMRNQNIVEMLEKLVGFFLNRSY